LKSAALSAPFLTSTLFTDELMICGEPTEFFGMATAA